MRLCASFESGGYSRKGKNSEKHRLIQAVPEQKHSPCIVSFPGTQLALSIPAPRWCDVATGAEVDARSSEAGVFGPHINRTNGLSVYVREHRTRTDPFRSAARSTPGERTISCRANLLNSVRMSPRVTAQVVESRVRVRGRRVGPDDLLPTGYGMRCSFAYTRWDGRLIVH